MNIVDIIKTQPSWDREQVLSLPVYGQQIHDEMMKVNKPNWSSKEVLYVLYSVVSRTVNYPNPYAFIEYMKLQKTMVSRKKAQQLLKSFWGNTCISLHDNPELHFIVKRTIISLNGVLQENNSSTQQMRVWWLDFFLTYALNSLDDQ